MSLLDLITEDVVKVPLEALTKQDVFRELIEVLQKAGRLDDPETVYEAVLARDTLMSTALENGIAIPHAKTEAVKDLTLAVGISKKGIDCQSHDGAISQLFFLILAPPDQSGPHIEALSEIAKATRSNAFRRLLLSSGTASDVVETFCDS